MANVLESVPNASHTQLKEIIERNYYSKTPLFIWGAPGVGKSFVAKDVGKSIAQKEVLENQKGLEFVEWNKIDLQDKFALAEDPAGKFIFADIRVTQMDPSDLKGVPQLDTKNKYLTWLPPVLFIALGHPKSRGIILFDELNLAPPMVTAACYQLIHDKQVGEHSINKNIFIMAAGNRTVDRAAVNEMSAPLKNRFTHIGLEKPDAESWVKNFAIPKKIDNRIIGYLMYSNKSLNSSEADLTATAFPTPRSWELASKLIKKVSDDNPMLFKLLGSAVGTGPASGFKAFMKVLSQIDIAAILKEPRKAKKFQKDFDKSYACMVCLSNRFENICEYAHKSESLAGDLQLTETLDVLKHLDSIELTLAFLSIQNQLLRQYPKSHLKTVWTQKVSHHEYISTILQEPDLLKLIVDLEAQKG